MRAVADQDHPTLERWAGHGRRGDRGRAWTPTSAAARCACSASSRGRCRGAASRPPTARTPTPPGTLFPRSSKKAARAINAASGNRPLVVLANLSGFDGSPDSMRNLQLEYGAEIGRAIVNFDGPIVFCVISRYHGGAFVVFSKALNPRMTVLAVEGSFASVIGGAPAAAVVFSGEVDKRARGRPAVPRARGAGRGGRRARRGPRLLVELADLRTDAARREDQRGGGGVRRGAQHPPGGRGRLRGRGDRGGRAAPADHRRDRAEAGPDS